MMSSKKNVLVILSKPIAKAADMLAKASSSSVNFCFTYQPDVPEKLRTDHKAEK